MAEVKAWFERKFEFNFALELYPNLCARLRGTPSRLEEIVRGVSPETLVLKPQGKWSAQEHAGHLLDLETLWMSRVNDFLAGGPTLTPADLTNRNTDEANFNTRQIEEILAQFRTQRSELLSHIEVLDPADFSKALLHPRLKQPMRLIDHLFFVAEHDDHHLARIWELVRVNA